MAELRTHREVLERSETAIVSALLQLPSSYIILPHLMLPSVRWEQDPDDVDAIVLSPAGIFLLEYKHWHGRVELSEADNWQLFFVGEGFEMRPNALPVLEQKAQALSSYLAQHGFEGVPIHRAVVFPERTEREGNLTVPVLSTTGLSAWIEAHLGQQGACDPRKMADELRPPTPIRMVNQYQLTSQLKKTQDKTTYLAYDTMLEQPVHLCQLQYDPYLEPELLERTRNDLLREAKLTMKLKHANILDVRHVIPRDDCYYIVSEWIDSSQNLKELLSRTGTLAVEVALDIGISIAGALDYAHGQGIVHRDIRPENILISPPKTVKLAHFGMAKKADIGTRSTFDLRKMMTESPYAAPEFRLGQEGHHRVDGRADLFSVGVLLYQMLTGKVPNHVDERYFEPPSTYNSRVPEALDEVIAKAIRFDPAQRFSTASALKNRLEWIRGNNTFQEIRYVQRKLIKRTRNSLIFSALDSKLGRTVALKKLLIDPGLNSQDRDIELQSLLREAKLASSLKHPHIVAIYDHFVEDDDGYLVMEWVEGADLRAHLEGRRNPLTIKEIVAIVDQVGDALEYAHSQGIIHRDIKPENIIYHQGRATVLDFGIAHAGEKTPGQDIGKTCGTARYIAPEILIGDSFNASADVFSLGVVFYELLTGSYPYSPDAILTKYSDPLQSDVVPPSQQNLEVPSELDAVILKALSIDPQQRYASMAEFLAGLHQLGGRGVQRKGAPRKVIFLSSGAMIVAGALFWIFSMINPNPQVLPLAESPSPLPLESASPDILVANPSPSESPTPEPSPTLEESPSPSPTPHSKVSWAGRSISIDGVTAQIERMVSDESKTTISLRVRNDSDSSVSFLNRQDRPDLLTLYDDNGGDYTEYIDYASIPQSFLAIDPGTEARGTLVVHQGIRSEAGSIILDLGEYGGNGRKFTLKGYKIVD